MRFPKFVFLAVAGLSLGMSMSSSASVVFFHEQGKSPLDVCERQLEHRGKLKPLSSSAYDSSEEKEGNPSVIVVVRSFYIGPVYAKCAVRYKKTESGTEVVAFDEDFGKNGFSNGVLLIDN